LKNEILLTDVDGVLLDWIGGFESFMNSKYNLFTVDPSHYDLNKRLGIEAENGGLAYIQEFNHSELIGQLNPFKDAVEYVAKFHENGYKLVVITSLSKNDSSCQARIDNLQNIFGDVFEDYVFLDIGQHKRDALAKFEGTGCKWIEDLPKNAMDGVAVGLDTYLLRHTYNADFASNELTIVDDWKQIYDGALLKDALDLLQYRV
jgi:FMN phosphatase YigB (HAD superfamily)